MRIDGLELHEVALYARGNLAAVAAARHSHYDVSKEGPPLSFLRGCAAYQDAFTADEIKQLAIAATLSSYAKPTRQATMRAVTLVTAALTGKHVEPYYESLVLALKDVECSSSVGLRTALDWHKKTGSTFALSSIAMSLAFWLRRAKRTDLAVDVLMTLMDVAVTDKQIAA